MAFFTSFLKNSQNVCECCVKSHSENEFTSLILPVFGSVIAMGPYKTEIVLLQIVSQLFSGTRNVKNNTVFSEILLFQVASETGF